MGDSQQPIPVEHIAIRGQKVTLDRDLTELYGTPTFRFNEAVKRNLKQFPDYFMFQLTAAEDAALTSHIAISNSSKRSQIATGLANMEVSLISLFF